MAFKLFRFTQCHVLVTFAETVNESQRLTLLKYIRLKEMLLSKVLTCMILPV